MTRRGMYIEIVAVIVAQAETHESIYECVHSVLQRKIACCRDRRQNS